mgnify:CR=1 FL=1
MKQLRILVVDDAENIRFILGEVLRKHRVKTASSGMDGLKIFFTDNFDLVITDHQMPGMLGVELIRKIKLSNSRVKAVLMSSLPSSMMEQVARAAGADGFLDKTIMCTKVHEIINNLFPILLS